MLMKKGGEREEMEVLVREEKGKEGGAETEREEAKEYTRRERGKTENGREK